MSSSLGVSTSMSTSATGPFNLDQVLPLIDYSVRQPLVANDGQLHHLVRIIDGD